MAILYLQIHYSYYLHREEELEGLGFIHLAIQVLQQLWHQSSQQSFIIPIQIFGLKLLGV